MPETSLRELDLARLISGREYFPSPQHWEDEVLYFLLVDRFSDGAENLYRDNQGQIVTTGSTPPMIPEANGNAVRTEWESARWREAGGRFVGGTLAGLESKLGYLMRLGVTAIWISPIFKQVRADETYHGYAIQNFLDVDPHFGSREDLRRLVQTAHGLGIRVILDIILNHCGDVFRYRDGDPFWNGQKFPVYGFRDNQGVVSLPFGPIDPADLPRAFPDGAIWPAEFQRPESFTCEGRIRNFEYFPEYGDGDFFDLKDLHHGERRILHGADAIDAYSVSPTLTQLCDVYKFWIAFADVDGFRLDTVKHMDPGAARFFASVIHEFTEALGKENFYLIGEITGGRDFAYERLEVTGLDAALGISDERAKMTALVRGEIEPVEYFDLFRNSLLERKDFHVWLRDKLVTSVDDHDHIDQGEHKRRFCAGGFERSALAILAFNATTLGIPCIYYGTEQLFDGEGAGNEADRYIREAMFGGEFGPFRSRGHHCFDEDLPVHRELAKIHRVRRKELSLRRGRQFLRQISGDGENFGFPARIGPGPLRSIVAWSRIFDNREVLAAINTDPDAALTAFVTIDNELQAADGRLTCLYSTDATEIGGSVAVEPRNGKAVLVRVPAAGFVLYA